MPWIKFYPDNWLGDTELQSNDFSTIGFWMNMIARLWKSNTRGKIIGTYEDIGNLMGCTSKEAEKYILNLKHSKAADIRFRRGKVTIINRRMLREEMSRTSSARAAQRFRDKGGGNPENWTAIRVDILRRDNYMCAYCGKKAHSVDHVVPRSEGGTEDYSNLVACCKSCNSIKGTRTLDDAGIDFWHGFDKKKLHNNIEITPQIPDTRRKNPETIPKEAIELTNLFLELRMIDKELTLQQTERWFQEIWKLNRIDKESWKVIESVIRWVLNDEFWRTNCHSPLKFRRSKDGTRYWDLFKALSSKSGIRDQIVGETEYGKNEL